MQIYKIGGAVRNKLLNIPLSDNDYVVVGSTIEEMQSLGFEKVGKSFPVFLHPTTKEEYALARKEIKTGLTHQDFKFVFDKNITLKEDSLRRDFTCNAIYEDINTGEIIDYHNGIKDIKNKVLRHISPHFKEDPLRVLRACRFVATLNFTLAPETITICKEMIEEGAITHLSKERIFQELEKSLSSPYFYRFIETAREIGLLKDLMPEVEDLWLIPEREDYHPEKNTGAHTILALKSAKSNDPIINLAILLHDVGKTKTNPTQWPSHHNHENLGVEISLTILNRLKAPNIYKKFIPFIIKNHMISHTKNANHKDIAQLAIFLRKHFKHNYFKRFLEVTHADLTGRELNNLDKEEQQFINFSKILEHYYHIASLPKSTLLPNLEDLLDKLKSHQITKEYLLEQELEAILKYKTLG